ncbi:MAG: ABC transporter substrate-binding protein [Methylocapsa sp.]|nr:ABC transporter substrate-binding protein [Methylocapsa sp.]
MYPETRAIDNPNLAGSGGVAGPSPDASSRKRTERPLRQREVSRRFFLFLCALPAAALLVREAKAAERLRIAAQKTGTFAFELAVAAARGFDRQAGLDIAVTEVASPEAAKIALLGGSADIILSDWLWAARQRSLDGKLVFFPYSTAVGALLVPPDSPLKSLSDLRGRKIAVAGGPLDKSWLLLQAYAKSSGLDLAKEADIIYGAPALLYQKALSGEADATLNYWNFCAALESRGHRRLIAIAEVERRLGAAEPVAMVGYVFSEKLAETRGPALARFFAVTAKAREVLAHSDAYWEEIGKKAGITNASELALFRKTYIEGIPRRSAAQELVDARQLYRILSRIGGPELTGGTAELDDSIFYRQVDGAHETP